MLFGYDVEQPAQIDDLNRPISPRAATSAQRYSTAGAARAFAYEIAVDDESMPVYSLVEATEASQFASRPLPQPKSAMRQPDGIRSLQNSAKGIGASSQPSTDL